MPELPEVETVVRSIAPLVGRRIISAEFRCLRILRSGDPEAMAERLRRRRIAGVKRFGKFILISLEGGGYLVVHLGMTGRLLLGGEAGKHVHAILTLDRGVLLYEDSRQFGCIQFSEDIPERVQRLGPEPLEITFEDFAIALRRRKTRAKALLLNQTFLRGIGNIYADEALFRAGIHPLTMASRLRRERALRLHQAIVRR
jgi:formamidopyrimidine-DNA glycosylase